MSLLNEYFLWFLEEEEDKACSSQEPYPVPASVLASKEASLEVLETSSFVVVVVDEVVSLDEDPFGDEEKTCFEETVQASASSAEDEEEEVDEGQT